MNKSVRAYLDVMNKRILSTPYEQLSKTEKDIKKLLLENCSRQVYNIRTFTESTKDNYATVGVRIDVSNTIDDLIKYFVEKKIITSKDAVLLEIMESEKGKDKAIDYLDCKILKVREYGSLQFNERYSQILGNISNSRAIPELIDRIGKN